LNSATPSAANASDCYTVDFTTTSGNQSIWATGFGGGDVVYPDRVDEDKKLLTYTTAPLESDVEITGTPVLTLEMSSTSEDGAIHAYLEDASPEMRVTYVDEGVFRIVDRKEVYPRTLPYQPLGPAHSYSRCFRRRCCCARGIEFGLRWQGQMPVFFSGTQRMERPHGPYIGRRDGRHLLSCP
jgi:hypothetical protein